MIDILAHLARDENLSPAFRRVIANPASGYLETAAEKAAQRRFTGEPLTGFGELDEDRALAERACQYAEFVRSGDAA